MKKEVSVVVIFRNEEKHIEQCIKSILNQTYKNFELIIVNDASTDRSKQIVLGFDDKRIEYYENKKHLGLAQTRNVGVSKAKGEYIFFTDADCLVDKDWIKQGLRHLTVGFAGVQGRTFYLNREPTLSDRVIQQLKPSSWGTNNIAYRKIVIVKAGGFNSKFDMAEDRDLAFRVQKYGKISFNKNMLAFHQIKKWTAKSIVRYHIEHAKLKVYLRKYHNDSHGIRFRYLTNPKRLATIFFPFIFPIVALLRGTNRIRSWEDVKMMFLLYIAYIAERIYTWKTAIEEGIFLV